MRSPLVSFVIASGLVIGCSSRGATLVKYEVPNINMTDGAPSGLTVSIPNDCKLVPLNPYETEETTKNYNTLKKIQTPSGANVSWAVVVPSNTDDSFLNPKKIPLRPGFRPVTFGKWKGTKAEYTDSYDGTGKRLNENTGVGYFVGREQYNLTVSAVWKIGNEKGQEEGIAAAEAFLNSVEINYEAKSVDIYPGAGEEPNQPIPEGIEVAMPDGMMIEATTPKGVIRILAGPDLKRSYTWDGDTRSVIMLPREERWHGSKGLYYPGPGDHWKEHKGITRGVVEEGRQNFNNVAEASNWLRKNDYLSPVWTRNGLVVGWDRFPQRRQLSVEVWQITIQNKKPTNLPGSHDSAIKILSKQK